MTRTLIAVAVAVALGLGACTSHRTGSPGFSVRDDTVDLRRRDKVDILFMVDNSPGLPQARAGLRQAFPQLIKRIDDLAANGRPASFHIGVVDSDLGAGPETLNQGQCHPGGDNGELQIAPTAGSGVMGCSAFSLGNGERFIDYASDTGVSNVIGLRDVPAAFGCISGTGGAGCGFEHQLESVYRALTTPGLNDGFLRDDALLVVFWLTDEDDCSAPPDTNLFDPSPAGVSEFGALHSFRCTQFGITCDGKMLDGSALSSSNCAPLTGGPLFDVARYTDLFTKPRAQGGIKDDPNDVLLASLIAPSTPVVVQVTTPCADQINTPSCPVLGNVCSRTTTSLSADPPVRIHALMQAAPGSVEGSICGTDFTPTIDAMADAMTTRMRAGCLRGAVVDLANPGCRVTVDGVDTPRCTGGGTPCWDLTDDVACTPRLTPAGTTQHIRLTVEGAAPDANVAAICSLAEAT